MTCALRVVCPICVSFILGDCGDYAVGTYLPIFCLVVSRCKFHLTETCVPLHQWGHSCVLRRVKRCVFCRRGPTLFVARRICGISLPHFVDVCQRCQVRVHRPGAEPKIGPGRAFAWPERELLGSCWAQNEELLKGYLCPGLHKSAYLATM